MTDFTDTPENHPFHTKPNRTFLALSVPVLFAMIAEPLTGLVDTAFVASLGVAPLAALGVGTMALSSIFWIFNFLSISTQTEVANLTGRGDTVRITQVVSLAVVMGAVMGISLALIMLPLARPVSVLLGAQDAVLLGAVDYVRYRLIGAPAMLLMLVGFGALRGKQDMNTPFVIAIAVNALNIALDYVLIFGLGAIPALGVVGSALATSLSQWVGAVWVLAMLLRAFGFSAAMRPRDALALLTAGRDLVLRTGLLVLFLLIATSVANRISAESGAAHQVIRQVWFFTGLALDAYAATAQSLVGYFYGAGAEHLRTARDVAALSVRWGALTGVGIAAVMLISTPLVVRVFVPDAAVSLFVGAWAAAAIAQPLTALAFVTDGIHWATSDYRYLRNAMIAATVAGAAGLALIGNVLPGALLWVWVITGVWVTVRGVLGMVRVWSPVPQAAPLTLNSPARPAASA